MNEFSIYVHVPWCRRRCPYCNFYLVVGRPSHNFVDAIIQEYEARKINFSESSLKTLYFGGGTPSLLAPDDLRKLINHLAPHTDIEISLEANPEDLTHTYIAGLKDSGVNRISLGVQSFDDEVLQYLGRKHSGSQAKEAIDQLLTVGLSNISIDLIIGVPTQDETTLLSSIDDLHDRNLPHVSTYLLTIEEETQFYRRISQGRMPAPHDDDQASIYHDVQQKLLACGYLQYDISSFAKPGFFSQHNQGYWSARDYLGLGPGAHSMRSCDHEVVRMHNHADLRSWLMNPCAESNWLSEQLTADEALRESLAFGLRNMHLGIDPIFLAEKFNVSLPKGLNAIAKKYIDYGWLEINDGIWRISHQGALFADAIMRDILGSS